MRSEDIAPPRPQPVAAVRAVALLASDPSSAPLSSRGLGRRPLMAETGVRIPVAVLDSPRVYGAFRVLGALREAWNEVSSVGRSFCTQVQAFFTCGNPGG